MANQKTYTPKTHPKNAATGKGNKAQTPGNAGSPGPSNHVPKVGTSADYTQQQQQQTDNK